MPAFLYALLLLCSATLTAYGKDSVVFRFETVGDSRFAPEDHGPWPEEHVWLQNSAVVNRFIDAMEPLHPQLFVFNGDMIYGYNANRAELDREYAYWRGMMSQLLAHKIYLLPVAGNHELELKSRNALGMVVKHTVPASEDAWRASMGDLVLDVDLWHELTGMSVHAWNLDNTPSSILDGIHSDQRQLTYSFDTGDIHIAVINTDPAGFDSSAPWHWLDQDLRSARQRGMKHLFVFGHKMAFPYEPAHRPLILQGHESGLEVHPQVRDAFWNVIEDNHATYFCGHEHVMHISQPWKSKGGTAWQVIVGSGGSPFSVRTNESDDPMDFMYAWADVQVYASGRVHIRILGFSSLTDPIHVLKSWDLTP